MISAPSSSSASWVSALTEAWVPTGMKNGVSTEPCGVVRRPRRAPVGSVFAISNEKRIFAGHLTEGQKCLSPFSVSGEDKSKAHAEYHENRIDCESDHVGLGTLQLFRIHGGETDCQQNQ